MRLAEFLWQLLNRLRRTLYRVGAFRGKRLHRPVISIGNLSVGGAGKTPAVIAVTRFLTARGLRVAVLTRGYGRSGSHGGPVLTRDAAQHGDEPVLIKVATNADVLVGANRYENARDFDCDVFVLDDGFQHLQLHRDFDLVIDAPARFHREGRSALRDADAVIPRRVRIIVPGHLRGKPVLAFAGLADNDQFFASLRTEGLDLAATRSFPDHHRYSPDDLAELKRSARAFANAALVTTAKDMVKIDDPEVIAIDAEFDIDENLLEELYRVAAPQSLPSDERVQKRRRKHPLLQRVEYLAYRFVAKRVATMRDDAVQRWGARLGAVARNVLRGRDRLAIRNLRRVFPDHPARELRRIADACWRHFGRQALVAVKTQNLSLKEVAARCPMINAHLVEEGIARGKGTLILSAHWGAWEVGGLAIMAHVRDVRTVARPLDNELLERELQEIRAKTGAKIVDRRKAARVLMRGLAENAVIILLPDQAVLPREGVLAPFLGYPAWTTPAPAKMAIRAGSTIVFGFCIPDGLRTRVEFQESLVTEAGMDPVELTAYINEVLSRRIRERPELWLWMHDRWKGTGEKKT